MTSSPEKTPIDLLSDPDREAKFKANEHGIWCMACGNQIVAEHHMHDPEIFLPDYCSECGYPDEAEMADYFTGGDE